MAKIALGTWAWGAGAFGGDAVFGSKTDVENLKPVFDAAMKAGLNLWDTATAYGMGESERILGTLAQQYERKDVEISTKFTPQIAEVFENSVEKMALASMDRMGIDYIDMYWIHNPMDVERWTPGLIPLLQSGKVKRVGVSNHNIKEIQRANEILAEAGFKVSHGSISENDGCFLSFSERFHFSGLTRQSMPNTGSSKRNPRSADGM